MRNNYKMAWHIRQYVKKELMDYKANKKMLDNYKGDTRGLILAYTRISQIDAVFDRLNKEDREAAEIIFIEKYSQTGAEIAKGLSKRAYYNAMNKVIYLVAIEMGLM